MTENIVLPDNIEEWGLTPKDINDIKKKIKGIPNDILPHEEEYSGIFYALSGLAPENVKVIILGQDPYPGKDIIAGKEKFRAHGLAFSFGNNAPAKDSIKNIFERIYDTTSYKEHKTTNLETWKKQKVLLLNTSLIYTNESQKKSWQSFWRPYINKIIETVIEKRNEKPLVIMLWGRDANSQKNISFKNKDNFRKKHPNIKILRSSHPSNNYNACNKAIYNGEIPAFSQCNHFTECNEFLGAHNEKGIDWNTQTQ